MPGRVSEGTAPVTLRVTLRVTLSTPSPCPSAPCGVSGVSVLPVPEQRALEPQKTPEDAATAPNPPGPGAAGAAERILRDAGAPGARTGMASALLARAGAQGGPWGFLGPGRDRWVMVGGDDFPPGHFPVLSQQLRAVRGAQTLAGFLSLGHQLRAACATGPPRDLLGFQTLFFDILKGKSALKCGRSLACVFGIDTN